MGYNFKWILFFFSISLSFIPENKLCGQNWLDGSRDGTYVMTFEAPKLRPVPFGYEANEWESKVTDMTEQLKDDKLHYELLGKEKMEDIKRYFEKLTDESASKRRKDAIERRMTALFEDKQSSNTVPYRGVYLDDNFRFKSIRTPLVEYIKFMKEYTEKSDGLISVCWNFGVDTLDFQKSSSSPIGHIFGKLPAKTKIKNPAVDSFYHHYKAKGYIQEDIAFFHDNETKIKSSCKSVHFSLCFLEVELEGDSIGYDWIVYVSKIDDTSMKECKSIDIEKCEPSKIDSTYAYKRVEPFTYFVPGLGWKKPDDKKLKPWMGLTVASIGLMGAGTYFKIQSDRHYNTHKSATTFEVLDQSYIKANDLNKKFIVTAGSGLALWLISDVWLFFKDKSQVKKYEEMFGSIRPKNILTPTGDPGIGFIWTKKF